MLTKRGRRWLGLNENQDDAVEEFNPPVSLEATLNPFEDYPPLLGELADAEIYFRLLGDNDSFEVGDEHISRLALSRLGFVAGEDYVQHSGGMKGGAIYYDFIKPDASVRLMEAIKHYEIEKQSEPSPDPANSDYIMAPWRDQLDRLISRDNSDTELPPPPESDNKKRRADGNLWAGSLGLRRGRSPTKDE